jgi:hypothetical protein
MYQGGNDGRSEQRRMTTKGKVPGSKLYGLKQAAGEVKE